MATNDRSSAAKRQRELAKERELRLAERLERIQQRAAAVGAPRDDHN
jgi:hypothetical protein